MVEVEYKSCCNCVYDDCEEYEYPCRDCRNNLCPSDSKYERTPLLWSGREKGNNVVNHPSHYTQGGIECIDAMVAAYGKEAVEVFCLLNAFKYLWRNEHKNGEEDLEKAIWYLKKRLELSNDE